jgi:hypothetical protein
VSVFTAPFTGVLDRHLTHWRPVAAFPRIVVDHPLQNLDDAALEARAQQIAQAALGYLPAV